MDESHILKFSAWMDLPPQWNALSLDCSTSLKPPWETRVSQAANEPGTCNLYGAPTYVARWDLDVLIWGPFAPGIWRQDIQVCPAFRHATSIGTFGCDPCNEAHDILYLHAYRSLSGDTTPSTLAGHPANRSGLYGIGIPCRLPVAELSDLAGGSVEMTRDAQHAPSALWPRTSKCIRLPRSLR